MEFLDGENLNEYTERTGPLPPDEVREIFDQICDAIGEMHELGIVHRDLKLENIYRARDKPRRMPFLIKVLDLGIARVIAAADAKTASSKTKPGLGSSYWMAPEQVKPDQKIDARTDVWALGLIAFRLLTGQSFWKSETVYGATPLAWIAESCIEELAGASERAAELECEALLPPGFDAWFAKCVNQDVEQRYANASVMFAAIEYWFVTVPAPSSIEEGPATDPMLEPPLGLLDEQRRLQVKTLAELPAKEAVEQPTHPVHVVDVREPDMLKPSAIEPGGDGGVGCGLDTKADDSAAVPKVNARRRNEEGVVVSCMVASSDRAAASVARDLRPHITRAGRALFYPDHGISFYRRSGVVGAGHVDPLGAENAQW